MKKLTVILGAIAASTSIVSIAAKKFSSGNNQEVKNRILIPTNQKHERLFEENSIITDKLNDLISFKDSHLNEQITPSIDESRMEEVLVPFLLEKFKQLAYKKGWNYKELDVKINYIVEDMSLKLNVSWKTSIYGNEHDYSDKFELVFGR